MKDIITIDGIRYIKEEIKTDVLILNESYYVADSHGYFVYRTKNDMKDKTPTLYIWTEHLMKLIENKGLSK